MLKYFVQTTEVLIVAALLVGLMLGYVKSRFGKGQRILMWIGTGAGLLGSMVMSCLKNTTSKIDTSMWNLRLFILGVSALVLFFVFSALRGLLNKIGKKDLRLGDWPPALCLALFSLGILVYAATDVWAYPYNILMVEKTLMSTTFILKCVGILLGAIFVFVAGLAAGKSLERLGTVPAFIVLALSLLPNGLKQASGILSILVTKRYILPNDPNFSTYFEIIKFTSNNSVIFIYAALCAAFIIPIIVWAMSFAQKEPYSNPAEKRKIRRKWRTNRRWATLVICCAAFTVVTLTGLKAITERVVQLSPIEDSIIKDDAVWVSFDQVSDGHLHRFAYTTENGVQVRFIVIKKPNSSSYGVGMDACDICGETGYYEKDGQVVCKLCDVVMNIQTIGFKGGCNPKIVEYSIKDGNIVVPCEALAAYEKDFK